MEFQEVTEQFDSIATEMSVDPGGTVPLSRDVIERVTEGDDDPRFATFVIESGWSKSKRYWGPELFNQVAAEMNSAVNGEPIVGYMGHIKDDDDGFAFPDIQLQWLGAKLTQTGDKARLAVKAYVLPGTKGRDYLRRGLVKTVSWRGKIAAEMFQQGVRVKEFHIESIDLSRPRKAGMSARMVGALTSEMENDEGRNTVKPDEIAALQANELRAHNPVLVKAIEDDVRGPLETKVNEMTTEADAVKPTLDLIPDLRKLLKLDDNAEPLAVISATITHLREAGKDLRDSVLNKVLEKKLKGGEEKDRALVRRVIVGEMRDRDITLTGDADKDEKAVTEMVNEVISGSDDLKEIVSEMEDTPPAVSSTGSQDRSGKTRELKPGTTTANLRVRSAS
jgi:hypothetical protein